ncbi:uncharacterized protein LOC142348025 [Convolutriloba macropyga]|uniref:uncharacterized protein LOC142348025 n=1 Tax=Convolutriloba macropyga TaxID=536237 RepID=UPI003F5247AF
MSHNLRNCWGEPGALDEDLFKCKDGSGCFIFEAVCDGIENCGDGSDEDFNCCSVEYGKFNDTHYGCGFGMCVTEDQLCNGPLDCPIGRDESPLGCRNFNNGDNEHMNSPCVQPYFEDWNPSFKPECRYFCGESPLFNFEYTRKCVAHEWNEEKQRCKRVKDPEKKERWCPETFTYHQVQPCMHNKPCTITQLSYKTNGDKDYYAAKESLFRFGFWAAKDLNFGYCDIGQVGNIDGFERRAGQVDVYDLNVTCGAAIRLDGRRTGPLRVTIENGIDGWRFDQVSDHGL